MSFSQIEPLKILSPNDVSILLPFPKKPEIKSAYLKLSNIIPITLFEKINLDLKNLKHFPGIFFENSNNTISLIDRFVAMAFRLDPCFKDLPTENCRPQLRLTFQAFSDYHERGGHFIIDGALHLFFDFPSLEVWTDFFKKIYLLKKNNVSSDLTVSNQFHDLSVLKMFQTIVASSLKSAKLSRIAFMSVEESGIEWIFKSYNVVNKEELIPVEIFGANSSIQDILLQSIDERPGKPMEYLGVSDEINKTHNSFLELMKFISDSEGYKGKNETNKILFIVKELQLPNVHLPGNSDCLSCHIAPGVEHHLFVENEHLSSFNQNYNNGDFIHFGYKGTEVKISKRVMNETSLVIDYIKNFVKNF